MKKQESCLEWKRQAGSFCVRVKFDNDGYIIYAENFLAIMWGLPDLDKQLIGKHITELKKMFMV